MSMSGSPPETARVFRTPLLLITVALVAVSACARGGTGGAAAAAAPAVVVVTTAPVLEKPMAVEARAVGNVEPSSTVAVRSQVTGELLSVEFTEGQDVAAGQVLFRLNPRQFEVALQQAQASLARSRAQLEGTTAQMRRAEELLAQGLLSRSEFDRLSTELAVYQAAIAADQAQIDNATLQLQYTTIAAPVAGRTGALLVHRGSLVRANDASPLVVINQVAPAFVSFAVPARLLTGLRRDQSRGSLRVLAAPSGSAEAAVTGTLSFVDNAIDPATDTIRLKASFDNRDRRLWPGAFVDVTLRLSVEPKAIVVPNASVQASQRGQYVYVVKADDTVEMRTVELAWTAGDDVVVRAGLAPGETVVTDGQLRLTPGARVSIKPAG
jgi:multidrug efflux system membrane fusion protein